MTKLTLSIQNKEKVEWAKRYANLQKTSLSRLIENYLDALNEFDQREIFISERLKSLRHPGKRPTNKEMERHLESRRKSRK
ncbi:MAG: DUF6364 family protein [Bacteroidota bacterium]